MAGLVSVAMILAACAAAGTTVFHAQKHGFRPRSWIVSAFMAVFLFGWLGSFSVAFGYLIGDRPLVGAAGLLAALILPGVALWGVTATATRRAQASPEPRDTMRRFERSFFTFAETTQPDKARPLGVARKRIAITSRSDSLTVVMPMRRSGATWVRGLVFLFPVGAYILYYVGAVLFIGFTAIVEGGGPSALGVIALSLVTGVIRMLPYVLLAAFGWYALFGQDVVTISPSKTTIRKVVAGEVGFTYRTLTYTLMEPIEVVARIDSQARWVVMLRLNRSMTSRRWDRELEFGGGLISESQADQLACTIDEWLAQHGERSPVSDSPIAAAARPV